MLEQTYAGPSNISIYRMYKISIFSLENNTVQLPMATGQFLHKKFTTRIHGPSWKDLHFICWLSFYVRNYLKSFDVRGWVYHAVSL
jgi:hypothetical protein